MIPPITEQPVPTAVIAFGWTPRATSQFATGSISRRYPLFTQSGIIFIRLRERPREAASRGDSDAQRPTQKEAGGTLRHVKVAFPQSCGNQRRRGHGPLVQGTGNVAVPLRTTFGRV